MQQLTLFIALYKNLSQETSSRTLKATNAFKLFARNLSIYK